MDARVTNGEGPGALPMADILATCREHASRLSTPEIPVEASWHFEGSSSVVVTVAASTQGRGYATWNLVIKPGSIFTHSGDDWYVPPQFGVHGSLTQGALSLVAALAPLLPPDISTRMVLSKGVDKPIGGA